MGDGYGINPFNYPWIPNWPGGLPMLKDGVCTYHIYKVADLINKEGQWNEDIIQRLFTRET